MALPRWTFTVCSQTPTTAAICLLSSPSATSAADAQLRWRQPATRPRARVARRGRPRRPGRPLQGRADGGEQLPAVEGLLQEVHRALAHGLDPRPERGAAAQEEDGELRVGAGRGRAAPRARPCPGISRSSTTQAAARAARREARPRSRRPRRRSPRRGGIPPRGAGSAASSSTMRTRSSPRRLHQAPIARNLPDAGPAVNGMSGCRPGPVRGRGGAGDGRGSAGGMTGGTGEPGAAGAGRRRCSAGWQRSASYNARALAWLPGRPSGPSRSAVYAWAWWAPRRAAPPRRRGA